MNMATYFVAYFHALIINNYNILICSILKFISDSQVHFFKTSFQKRIFNLTKCGRASKRSFLFTN